MITVERVKKLLHDPLLTDEQIEGIRDEFHQLAELIFDDWREKQLVSDKNKKHEYEK